MLFSQKWGFWEHVVHLSCRIVGIVVDSGTMIRATPHHHYHKPFRYSTTPARTYLEHLYGGCVVVSEELDTSKTCASVSCVP